MTQGKLTHRYLIDDPPEWDVNDVTTGDEPAEPAAAASTAVAAVTNATTPIQAYL